MQKTQACKTRSWILQSRVLAARGDAGSAFRALRTSLNELGMSIPESPTWDECDIAYKKLEFALRETNSSELLSRPLSEDRDVIALGTVMAEAISAAFWSDRLVFYQVRAIFIHSLDISH